MINTKKLEADILFKNNEFDKALKIFQELEKLNPNNFDIITKIANLLELQHQYKNSINYYLKALKIKNNNIELLIGNVSQVQIYNRVLSQQEISQNFNATRGRYGV